ncbi:MAG: YqgE/AlgH family protein [Gammaproteobacteria bacterium]
MSQASDLTGQFLIAMPAMGDPNFDHTVSFICEHSDQGALGIVVNRPTDMTLGEVLGQMQLDLSDADIAGQPVLQGGPVQPERGFVIHESDARYDSTLELDSGIRVTTSRDILEALARGEGPPRVQLALGYAGWGAGQLEDEMAANAWLTVPATAELIFSTPYERRWESAARLLGIDIRAIGPEAGHA